MTRDQWRRVEQLYLAACEHDMRERDAFLIEACAGDQEVLAEVRALLSYETAAEAFLEDAALAEAAKGLVEDSGPSLVGRQIGAYQILSLLGTGGMGEVYHAKDVKLGRDAAVKVLGRFVTGDLDHLRQFEEEARLASGLNHPNIVTIYGVGEQSNVTYLAMEFVDGQTLRDLCAETALSMERVLDLAVQMADALAAAHGIGIIHGDLKPENVMITREGLLKVLDFGLARRQVASIPPALEEAQRTEQGVAIRNGMILGSVGYISPEQAAGLSAGTTSDQFSLGAILYEMLSGRRAFAGATALKTLTAIVREQPIPVRSLNLAVGRPLEQLVERCLEKDPTARYSNTKELAAELRRIRRDQAGVADQRFSSDRATGLTRRRALWLGGAGAIVATAGFAAWRTWSHDTGIRSLAVLPFTNTMKDESFEYLSDGITENLISRISLLPSLKVMARSTVFNFKGKNVDPRAAGRQLAVDAILTGTVAQRSGRLLITAELVDVATGARLWSNTYERAAAAVLSVQDEIANAIVDEGIRLRLSDDERRRLVRHPTDDPESYALYLRAVHQHRQETERGYLSARELLQQAIARDPKFALAYAALAATYMVMAVDGFERPADARPQINRNVRQALDLDPDLSNAHAEAASEAFFLDWDWAGAEREWKMAMQSRAGDFEPDSLLGYSLERWALGRPVEALQLARQAREMDPLSPTFAVREADLLLQTGQLEAAVSLYETVIHDEPGDPRPYFGLAEVRRIQGRFNEAFAVRRKGHELAGDDALQDVTAKAESEAGYRQVEQAAARLELAGIERRDARGDYASPLDFARAYARLGDKEKAFGYFDAAFADRAPGLVFLNVDRAWDSIRDDARFRAYVRRVGLP